MKTYDTVGFLAASLFLALVELAYLLGHTPLAVLDVTAFVCVSMIAFFCGCRFERLRSRHGLGDGNE